MADIDGWFLVVLLPLLVVGAWFGIACFIARRLPERYQSLMFLYWSFVVAFFGMFLSIVFLVPAFGLLIVLLFAAERHPSTQTVSVSSKSIAGALLIGAIGICAARMKLLTQMRADYPVVSVADRLAYEDRRPATESDPLSRAILRDLKSTEIYVDRFVFRNVRLQNLHQGSELAFVLSSGFGVGRLATFAPTPERLRLPEDETPALDQFEEVVDSTASSAEKMRTLKWADAEISAAPIADWGESRELDVGNYRAVVDFIDPTRMGYVEHRDYVVGFAPHAIVDPEVAESFRREDWSLSRLELVSLLKHETPRVYISEHLPNMEELIDVPTRDLDLFEVEALKRLNQGEQLVIQEFPTKIRMLGGLRAAEQCLKCHQVRHGELLGAFSYKIIRRGPVPPERKDEPGLKPLL